MSIFDHIWPIDVHSCTSIHSCFVFFSVSTGYLFPCQNHCRSGSSSVLSSQEYHYVSLLQFHIFHPIQEQLHLKNWRSLNCNVPEPEHDLQEHCIMEMEMIWNYHGNWCPWWFHDLRKIWKIILEIIRTLVARESNDILQPLRSARYLRILRCLGDGAGVPGTKGMSWGKKMETHRIIERTEGY